MKSIRPADVIAAGHSARYAALAILAACGVTTGFAAGEEPLRRGLGPEPDSLDIHQAQGLAAVNLLRDLREGLVTFDEAGNPAPGVAASWEVLDRGLRYRFWLRDDARWSNGDPVTSADFVRAWQRAFSPQTAAATAGLLHGVENAAKALAGDASADALGISAVGEHELEIRLERPMPWLPELLAHPVSYPLHPAGGSGGREEPVNGAFTLAERVPRAMIRLNRNPSFHGAAEVRTEIVEYYPIEEPNTELARYRAGELDITETIPAGRYAWLIEQLPGQLHVSPYLGSFWLGVNLRHPHLGPSVDLRRALALAIDRDTLVKVVLGAGEKPAFGVVPPGLAGYNPAQMPEIAWPRAQRNEEAVRLLLKAGYRRGEAPLLELRYNTSGLHRRIAVAVAAMWKQVLGVNTELINEEWKVFVNNRRLGIVTQVFRGGWIADYADPASFLDLFLTGGELNTTFMADESFDRLMGSAAMAKGEARFKLLREAETRLLESLPVIPLYYYVSRHLVNPAVCGYTDNVRDIHLSRYLYKEEKATLPK